MYIVYKTTCLINNKIYIGVHQTETPDKFDGYYGCGFSIKTKTYLLKHPSTPLHFAIKKYGMENFKRETLYIFESKTEAYQKESEIVNVNFVKSPNTYNAHVGGICGPIKKSTKTVFQFSTLGELLRSFANPLEASKCLDCHVNSIRTAINKKVTVQDTLFSYTPTIDVSEFQIAQKTEFFVYNSLGELINIFNTKKELTDFLGETPKNLNRSINCRYPLCGYFVTRTKLDNVNILITPKNSEQLNRYSLQGDYIDSFGSVKEAKEKLQLSLRNISSAIRGFKSCNGFFWTRNDNPPQHIKVKNTDVRRQVEVLDVNTNRIIQEFTSVVEASKVYPSARYILNNRCSQPKGLILRYKL